MYRAEHPKRTSKKQTPPSGAHQTGEYEFHFTAKKVLSRAKNKF